MDVLLMRKCDISRYYLQKIDSCIDRTV